MIKYNLRKKGFVTACGSRGVRVRRGTGGGRAWQQGEQEAEY